MEIDDIDAFVSEARRLIGERKYENALDLADRVSSRFSGKALYHWQRASILEGLRDLQRCLTELDRTIELDPTEPAFLFERCRVRLENGDNIGSIADGEAMLRLEQEIEDDYYGEVVHFLGALAYIRLAEFKRALLELEKVDPSTVFWAGGAVRRWKDLWDEASRGAARNGSE